MIVGRGDIAQALKEVDREDVNFFASGVSNSQEIIPAEFVREAHLLMNQPRNMHIVYFSSLCIFYSTTLYAVHKRAMEQLIKNCFKTYTIIRLGNITWGKNPHTIINYFRAKIKKGEKLEIRDEYRYLVDQDEFIHWIRMIPEWSCEMNITGKRLKVADIVKEYGNT